MMLFSGGISIKTRENVANQVKLQSSPPSYYWSFTKNFEILKKVVKGILLWHPRFVNSGKLRQPSDFAKPAQNEKLKTETNPKTHSFNYLNFFLTLVFEQI